MERVEAADALRLDILGTGAGLGASRGTATASTADGENPAATAVHGDARGLGEHLALLGVAVPAPVLGLLDVAHGVGALLEILLCGVHILVKVLGLTSSLLLLLLEVLVVFLDVLLLLLGTGAAVAAAAVVGTTATAADRGVLVHLQADPANGASSLVAVDVQSTEGGDDAPGLGHLALAAKGGANAGAGRTAVADAGDGIGPTSTRVQGGASSFGKHLALHAVALEGLDLGGLLGALGVGVLAAGLALAGLGAGVLRACTALAGTTGTALGLGTDADAALAAAGKARAAATTAGKAVLVAAAVTAVHALGTTKVLPRTTLGLADGTAVTLEVQLADAGDDPLLDRRREKATAGALLGPPVVLGHTAVLALELLDRATSVDDLVNTLSRDDAAQNANSLAAGALATAAGTARGLRLGTASLRACEALAALARLTMRLGHLFAVLGILKQFLDLRIVDLLDVALRNLLIFDRSLDHLALEIHIFKRSLCSRKHDSCYKQ
mmetsp:Transcript_62871/g.136670  ORF Transcript_62871/g.136670 Transcript_62871/m.136670 type:complete len:498 (-) Transcript_62871:20-1513(-)